MKLLTWLHRWTGGIIGLLLALLGLTGALLVWKDAYLRATVTGASDLTPQSAQDLSATMQTIFTDVDTMPNSVRFATDGVGVHSVHTGPESGYYITPDGTTVASWNSVFDRFELWLFDLHHYLMLGDMGETIAGIAGLIGIAFVITGLILWWPTRKTFKFRIWPARMSRPAIIRQHRDIGVVLAPLLFLTMLTGTMMVLRPVAAILLMPFSSIEEMETATKPPEVQGGTPVIPDWPRILTTAQDRFPDATLRIAAMPREPGGLIQLRMRQAHEWLPNGRTLLWFDPATSNLVEARAASDLPQGWKVFNLTYPVHAAKVGGVVYKIIQTLTGLALALLGSLAVWSFWFRKPKPKSAPRKAAMA